MNSFQRSSVTGATNRLSSVDDTHLTARENDMPDQDDYNYHYDASGRMTADTKSGITAIAWNVQNKVKSVTRDNGDVIQL